MTLNVIKIKQTDTKYIKSGRGWLWLKCSRELMLFRVRVSKLVFVRCACQHFYCEN